MTLASALPPSASGGITRLALARAEREGLDTLPLLRQAGLTAAEAADPNLRLAVSCQITLLNLLAAALRDDLLGFHLAREFDVREAGLLYYVLASSATLGDGLDRSERFSRITNEGIRVRCLRDPGMRLAFTYLGVSRHTDRHQIEFWTTAIVRICREVTATRLKPNRVRLAHPRLGSSAELDRFFGCAVDFGLGQDEIGFAPGASGLRLIGADPYLNDLLTRHGEEVLASRGSPVISIRARVENAIAPLLPHGKALVGEVATALGMSRRTLARRLGSEGLTFGAILNDMRRALAEHYLADEDLSISRIAWLVGYQEVSAFTNAFRRWTGLTPTQMRARSTGRASAPRERRARLSART